MMFPPGGFAAHGPPVVGAPLVGPPPRGEPAAAAATRTPYRALGTAVFPSAPTPMSLPCTVLGPRTSRPSAAGEPEMTLPVPGWVPPIWLPEGPTVTNATDDGVPAP